jgi:hypothetical protein
MARSYRLYHVSPQGEIARATACEFPNDRDALIYAAVLAEAGHVIELWQTDRIVGRVEWAPAPPGLATAR